MKRSLVACLVAISLLMVAIVAWKVSSSSRATDTIAGIGGGDQRDPGSSMDTAIDVGGRAEIAARVQDLEGVSQSDAAVLAERSTQLLEHYRVGDPERFKAWLRGMGQAYVPPSRGRAYATDDEQWRARAAMVGQAEFNLKASYAVLISRDGQLQPPMNLAGRSKMGNARKVDANGTPDPTDDETTAIEVIIPRR